MKALILVVLGLCTLSVHAFSPTNDCFIETTNRITIREVRLQTADMAEIISKCQPSLDAEGNFIWSLSGALIVITDANAEFAEFMTPSEFNTIQLTYEEEIAAGEQLGLVWAGSGGGIMYRILIRAFANKAANMLMLTGDDIVAFIEEMETQILTE